MKRHDRSPLQPDGTRALFRRSVVERYAAGSDRVAAVPLHLPGEVYWLWIGIGLLLALAIAAWNRPLTTPMEATVLGLREDNTQGMVVLLPATARDQLRTGQILVLHDTRTQQRWQHRIVSVDRVVDSASEIQQRWGLTVADASRQPPLGIIVRAEPTSPRPFLDANHTYSIEVEGMVQRLWYLLPWIGRHADD